MSGAGRGDRVNPRYVLFSGTVGTVQLDEPLAVAPSGQAGDAQFSQHPRALLDPPGDLF